MLVNLRWFEQGGCVKNFSFFSAVDPDWRTRYGRVDPADRERLLTLGDERRRQRAERASMNQQKEQEKHERA